MSQRGGSVISSVRIADRQVASDIIGTGTADLLIGLEPLEASRALAHLAASGVVVAGVDPTRNIPDYPEVEQIVADLERLPGARVVESIKIAREAGSPRTAGTVLVGAASDLLPMEYRWLEEAIAMIFGDARPSLLDANLKALALGRGAIAVGSGAGR